MAHICQNDMIQIKDMFQILVTWLQFSTEEYLVGLINSVKFAIYSINHQIVSCWQKIVTTWYILLLVFCLLLCQESIRVSSVPSCFLTSNLSVWSKTNQNMSSKASKKMK